MQKHLKLFVAVGAIILLTNCATRNVVVIDTACDIVRLDKPVKAAVSITRDGVNWIHAGEMEIPAGWYAGPGPKE